jgi:hypothetical protein
MLITQDMTIVTEEELQRMIEEERRLRVALDNYLSLSLYPYLYHSHLHVYVCLISLFVSLFLHLVPAEIGAQEEEQRLREEELRLLEEEERLLEEEQRSLSQYIL